METSKIHALLKVEFIGEDAEKQQNLYSFELFWSGKTFPESPEKVRIYKNVLTNIRNRISNKEISSEEKLKQIGGQIWGFLPREIKKKMKRFDEISKQLLSASGSKVMLTIKTNRLDIPWELACTGSDIGKEENSYWFRRYLIGRELIGHTRDEMQRSDDKQRRILVVHEPFDVDRISNNGTREEFKKCNDELKELIDGIKNESNDFYINSYRFQEESFDYNILGEHLKGLEEPYDVILYIGGYKNKPTPELLIEDKVTKEMGFKLEYINPYEDTTPLIFLDACETGVEKEGEDIVLSDEDIRNVVGPILTKGFVAFVGTFAPVEGVVATNFAYYFLESLCKRGYSLAHAVYDARNKTWFKYSEKSDSNSKLRCAQSCAYSLIGDCTGNLYYSFLHNKKKIKLLWSDIADPYFSSFGDEIHPSGMELDPFKCDDFEDLIEKFHKLEEDTEENLIPLIDMPILYAIEEINNGGEWVIVNSTFRLTSEKKNEDATLYYFGDIKDIKEFFLQDKKSTVSVMAHICLDNRKVIDKFTNCSRHADYKHILRDIKDSIDSNTLLDKFGNQAFLLSGKYRDEFEKLKESFPVLKEKIDAIELYTEFNGILENNNKFSRYKIEKGLPASVIIARREDVERYRKLLEEVFLRWYNWRNKTFSEKYKELLKRQEQIYFKDEDEKKEFEKTCIDFSKLVKDALGSILFGEKIDIRRELREEDFYIVEPRLGENEKTEDVTATSPQWSEEEIRRKRGRLLWLLDKSISDMQSELEKKNKERCEELEAGKSSEAKTQLNEIKKMFDKDKEFIRKTKKMEKEIENVKDEKRYSEVNDQIRNLKIDLSKYDRRIKENN